MNSRNENDMVTIPESIVTRDQWIEAQEVYVHDPDQPTGLVAQTTTTALDRYAPDPFGMLEPGDFETVHLEKLYNRFTFVAF
jgi:hypothetical protein